MRSIRLPGEMPVGSHWLMMDETRMHALTEEARRALCRDWSDRSQRLRHVMRLVLLHQLDGVRDAVRTGALGPDEAARGMRSAFGLGYLHGLVMDHAETCGLPADGGIAAAGLLDLHLLTFGLVEGQALMKAAPRAERGFATGILAAEWDVETYKSWLEGAEEDPNQGLRDGLLKLPEEPAAAIRACGLD